MTTIRKILVACDLGEEAGRALDAAKGLATWTKAEVHLVHVFDPMPMVPPIALAPGYTIGDDILTEIRANIRAGLEKLQKEYFGAGASKLEMLEGSSPARLLCEHAERHKFDVIIIGTHGRKGASRILLGSVAERVVREAPCSVWVAR